MHLVSKSALAFAAAAAVANAQSTPSSAVTHVTSAGSGLVTGTPNASINGTGLVAAGAVTTAVPLDAAQCSIKPAESTGTKSWPYCGCTQGVAGLMLLNGSYSLAYCGQVGSYTMGSMQINPSMWSSIAAQAITDSANGVTDSSEPTLISAGTWTVQSPTPAGSGATGANTAASTGSPTPSGIGANGFSSSSNSSTVLNGPTAAAPSVRPSVAQPVMVALAVALGFFAFYV